MIGIVGGVGPYAGIDLMKNIFDNTLAKNDQDHLDTLLFSLSSRIMDRTEYLIGNITENPGHAISKIILGLERSGATVVGIPCNTAHAPEIFSLILKELNANGSQIKVFHMINETIDFIKQHYPHISKIGVLSTTGTYKQKIYSRALANNGFTAVMPPLEMQENVVHPAIYNPEYGIKSQSNPFHSKAKENLESALDYLKEHGSEAVILGCTEIPLVITTSKVKGMLAINPTTVLARKLIESIASEKLKPL